MIEYLKNYLRGSFYDFSVRPQISRDAVLYPMIQAMAGNVGPFFFAASFPILCPTIPPPPLIAAANISLETSAEFQQPLTVL